MFFIGSGVGFFLTASSTVISFLTNLKEFSFLISRDIYLAFSHIGYVVFNNGTSSKWSRSKRDTLFIISL